jgi:hypothetical protein
MRRDGATFGSYGEMALVAYNRDMDKDTLAKAAEVVTEGAIEVLKVVPATLVVGASAGAAVALPMIAGTLVQKCFDRRAEKARRQFESWMLEVGRRLDAGNPEGAVQHILESVDEAWAHDAVVDGAQALFLGMDEAAVPLLAALTAMQVSNKHASRRDRRTVALLLDCDQASIEAIRAFVGRCHGALADKDVRQVQISFYTLAKTVQEFGPNAGLDNRNRIQVIPFGKDGPRWVHGKVPANWPVKLHVETENAGHTSPGDPEEQWPAAPSDIAAIELLERHGFLVSGQTLNLESISEGRGVDRLTTKETITYLRMIFVEPIAVAA